MTDERHIPVMLKEVLASIKGEGGLHGLKIVDGTFGNGGYSRAFLAKGAIVVAIDRDPDAIAAGRALFDEFGEQFRLIEGCFGDLDHHLEVSGIDFVDGVVLDVGVSSMQLDRALRGFSFSVNGPLDMRMAQRGASAADVVNQFSGRDLRRIISVLGEEKMAASIARAIVSERSEARIETTAHLARIIERTIGRRYSQKTHPATRTFQAIRIFVNSELQELARALSAAEAVLRPDGRLVVVTFHSLEDRIVKKFLKQRSSVASGRSRYLPPVARSHSTFFPVNQRVLRPRADEVRLNPRARSARLRAAIRLEGAPKPLDMAATGVVPLSQYGLLSELNQCSVS